VLSSYRDYRENAAKTRRILIDRDQSGIIENNNVQKHRRKVINMGKDYPLYETTVFEDFRIMVENVANKYPTRIALSYKLNPRDADVVRVTYEEARYEIRDLGTGLIDLGCRDKHCAIIGSASAGWIYTYFALMAIGAVTVPLDKEWAPADLASTINKAECEYVFYAAESADKMTAVKEANPQVKEFICIWGEPRENERTFRDVQAIGAKLVAEGNTDYYDYVIDPDRLASIVFTSGTTGKGKGVMLSQTNIVSDMTQGMYLFDITPKTFVVLPPHHTYCSTVNLVGHYSQGSELYISSGLKYIQKELKAEKPSHLILVPLFVEAFYKKIWANARESGQETKLKNGIRLSNALRKIGIDRRKQIFASIHEFFGGNLDMIICGGAPLNNDIISFFDGIGVSILNGYGITECAPLISCNRNKWMKAGSVGVPIIGEEVKIDNPDEKGEGEICAKGPNVMLGYYKDEEATAAVFDEDGFFHTGDIGRLDKDGWIFITGRQKNIIILSNGKNVYPEELETVISTIEGVGEIIVHEGKTKTKKQVLVAEIFPDAELLSVRGIEPENYKQYFTDEISKLNKSIPPYKQIGYVKIRDTEFVKNTSRKITRFNIDTTIDE